MANEISISASLSASKNQANLSLSGTLTFDMAGNDMTQVTQEITNTPELLLLADVASPAAYVFVRNLESETNDINLSLNSDGSNKFARLKPGQFMLFPPAVGQNMYMAASVSTARAQVGAVEI